MHSVPYRTMQKIGINIRFRKIRNLRFAASTGCKASRSVRPRQKQHRFTCSDGEINVQINNLVCSLNPNSLIAILVQCKIL